MVLCNEFRHPVQLAKEAATIDVASGGRLELGIGAGWYEPRVRTVGHRRSRRRVSRLERLGEAVEILKRLFTASRSRSPAKHYRLATMLGRPLPVQRPRPTIWVGGKGDRAMRLIAVGRATAGTPRGSRTSTPTPSARALLGDAAVRRSIGQYAQGSAQEMVDRLASFAAAGVEHAVMCFSSVPFGLDDPDDLARFAQDVLPRLARCDRSGPARCAAVCFSCPSTSTRLAALARARPRRRRPRSARIRGRTHWTLAAQAS